MINLPTEVLNITLVQPDITWENKEDNLDKLTQYIDIIKEEHPAVDLVVLPEMFSTGFTMNPEPVAETMDGPTIKWMREISTDLEIALCGSLVIVEEGKFYNRFVFMYPNGELVFYDKKHLFAFAGEDKLYSAGSKKVLLEFKGWKISPFICYDLRFPVWCRNTDMTDIMIYVANWPETRISHWKALLPARAIENQCFVVGVNRVGLDHNNLKYIGQSNAFDPMGNSLGNLGEQEGVQFFRFEKFKLNTVRDKIPFLKDMDRFVIH